MKISTRTCLVVEAALDVAIYDTFSFGQLFLCYKEEDRVTCLEVFAHYRLLTEG